MGAASRRVIYCAGSRALAQLEKRVHANGITPVGQALFRLELPDGLVVRTAQAAELPGNWRDSVPLVRGVNIEGSGIVHPALQSMKV